MIEQLQNLKDYHLKRDMIYFENYGEKIINLFTKQIIKFKKLRIEI